MNLIPFGECLEDRVKISKDYKLIEKTGGIWRLTAKCKNAYDPTSYVYYLQGKVEKPNRMPKLTPQQEIKTTECQKIIEEILTL